MGCLLSNTATDANQQPVPKTTSRSLGDEPAQTKQCVKKDQKKPIEWRDTVEFVPPVTNGYVIKVYDGDTITIAAKLSYEDSPLYRFSVRLSGIDCPEIRGQTDDEKKCAQLAKKKMEEMVLHKNIVLKNVKTEKYGRILADVFVVQNSPNHLNKEKGKEGKEEKEIMIHVNEQMLMCRLAVEYNGAAKSSPANWMIYHTNA